MSLRVLEAGLQTLLVDHGRPATRGLGVPVGGAADRRSLALGNALVGNGPEVPALEIAVAGPTLQAEARVAGVVFGAPFDLSTDRQPLVAGKTFTLESDEILRIRGTPAGVRAYLCVPGGFDGPVILGSRSGLAPVKAGQVLACSPSSLPPRSLHIAAVPTESPQLLRFLPGSQADWFDLSAFAAADFAVSPSSNRMGLRLKGEPLPRPAREMVSEPVCPGAVQVTNDGQCIVLGMDGQTIGGYPKVAQVIRADLDCLAQLRPGQAVRFAPVALAAAEAIYRGQRDELRSLLARLAVAIEV